MQESRTLTHANAKEVAEWCEGILVDEHDALDHSVTSPGINLAVAGGTVQRASLNDVIIRLNDGQFVIFK